MKTIPILAAGFALLVLGGCTNVALSEVDRRVTYDVRVHPTPEHGYLRLSDYQVPGGTYITIYANPEPGFVLQDIILQNESQLSNPSRVNASKPKYSTQINNQTAVTAVFVSNKDASKYTISVDPSISGGLIYPEWLSEAEGSAIRINILPEPGFDISSLTVSRASGTPVAISADMPYTFTLPGEDVSIEAAFARLAPQDLKGRAWKYLSVGQYDTAAELYESAYQQDKNDPDLILYSTLGLLGNILIDPDVRSLLGSGSLYFSPVPGTIDDWVCDDVYWTGNDTWYKEYAATIYTPEDATLPKFYSRFSGYIKPFGDSPIAQEPGRDHLAANDQRDTREKFNNYIFWALISSYRSGFNPFVERVNRYVFGKNFDAALERAASLPADARVPLNPRLMGRFKLDNFYGPGDVYIGKPELDYVFGNLLAVKAAFEYLSAYDWTIDLRNWLMDYVYWNHGLEEVLQQMFSLQETYNTHKNLWKDPATVEKMLPFKNNFLTIRDARAIGKARTDIARGVGMANAAMDYWHGVSGDTARFTPAAQDTRRWARQAWAQAQVALASGGVFYFPKRFPRSVAGSYWPDGSQDNYAGDPNSVQYGNKVYGVNTAKFFMPGAFTLTNLFTTELGGRAPSLFKVEWYEDRDNSYASVFTGKYTLVTAPITTSGREEGVGGTTYTAPYGIYSFEVNTKNLKELFPKGFGDLGDENNGKELLYKVFPSILLWPWGKTYFTAQLGQSPGRKLYYFYHRTTVE